jgi:CRISPR-associated protein (TIGR03986 family)
MSKGYKFLNPYNFVRYLLKGMENSNPKVELLGRCPPPPHDRFVGLTGRMECRLETFTPIFISDSEFIEIKKDHKSYRFFTLKNEDGVEESAISSTSLRGMLRCVFEAATNSCFSVFDGGLLGKRKRPKEYSGMIQAGRITKIPDNEKQNGTVRTMKYHKLPHNKFPQYKDKYDKNGEKVFVKIEDGKIMCVKEGDANAAEGYIKGYLKTSGKGLPSGTKKQNEFVFIETEKPKDLTLSYETYYNYISANRNNKHEHTKVPKKGDTIWLRYEKNDVKEFGYAQIYRKPFEKAIGDLLPSELHYCEEYDRLCPACRLFGWVNSDRTQEKAQKIAYAGRIKISHGRLLEDKGVLEEFPLAILSLPKPTTSSFYLLDEKGKPDFRVRYAGNARLRGRKFYRHQIGEEKKEYRRKCGKKDIQNRTIRGALEPGAKFEFTVYFENLSPVELGALLWSIEMEEGMYHKIGLAKPLGFGSVKLSIENIVILDVRSRYSSFSGKSWNIVQEQKKNELLNLYKKAMEDKFGKSFEKLVNIRDLTAILSRSFSDLPVHYPRASETPDVDGKNFVWFMKNEKALEVACEDTEGLPLQ